MSKFDLKKEEWEPMFVEFRVEGIIMDNLMLFC